MTLARPLDYLIDRAVVPGYTRIGWELRRVTGIVRTALPRMDGRVVVVTGASSGIGLAASEGFARLGAEVVLVARDRKRGERARRAVKAAAGGARVQLELADLASLRSVRELAQRLAAGHAVLHVLVNNAGVLPSERELSADGLELTFATNVLAPFLLTNLLVPQLAAASPGRVVNVSSGGMYTQRIDVDDLQTERRSYDGPSVYARTKRAEVILTELFAERLQGRGVVVHSMHPGWASTPGLERSLPRFHRLMRPLLRNAQQGADTIVWLGAADEPARSSGLFWHDRRPRPTHRLARTRETAEERRRLWDECARLSGLRDFQLT